ncbi:hypothetical protein ACVW1C_001450 [Bradyrhizobium sp. USDA 4011]
MGSLPPCGGGLGRGVGRTGGIRGLPLSPTLPRKEGESPTTSRVVLNERLCTTSTPIRPVPGYSLPL